MSELNQVEPTYYVRHPDDSYSVADPKPTCAIPAKLQAAEKLRNAMSVYLEHMTEMNMLECGAALAAFDEA